MAKQAMCKFPGCFNYATGGGYCAKHQDYRIADAEKPKRPWDGAARPNDALYNTQRWKVLRAKMLRKYKTCALCPATENLSVHHIVPPKGDEELFFDENNLIVLCRDCHNKQTEREVHG